MKIAILGTGMVGHALGTKLVQIGHQIMMGSRTAPSEAGQEWLRSVNGKAQIGTFPDAAAFGEIILDCTNGANSQIECRMSRYDPNRHRPVGMLATFISSFIAASGRARQSCDVP